MLQEHTILSDVKRWKYEEQINNFVEVVLIALEWGILLNESHTQRVPEFKQHKGPSIHMQHKLLFANYEVWLYKTKVSRWLVKLFKFRLCLTVQYVHYILVLFFQTTSKQDT